MPVSLPGNPDLRGASPGWRMKEAAPPGLLKLLDALAGD
jgi:hypothetical protein